MGIFTTFSALDSRVSLRGQLRAAKREVYELLFQLIGKRFHSQAGQDCFVASVLLEKKGGFYLEVGGGHPVDSNNSRLLESDYLWTGLSLERDRHLVSLWREGEGARTNLVAQADALNFDFPGRLAQMQAPKQIDYLSLDIDPAKNTFQVLESLPHNTYRFSVITFEHDRYRKGDEYMDRSRALLRTLGYQLVVANLKVFGRDFEDWWVDPRVVPASIWEQWKCSGEEFSTLWLNRKPLG